MRLIDADELLGKLEKDPLFGLVPRYIREATIKSVSTVEVVRCKDCKHYDYHHPSHEQCIMWKHAHIKPSVDYCSYGKRREE